VLSQLSHLPALTPGTGSGWRRRAWATAGLTSATTGPPVAEGSALGGGRAPLRSAVMPRLRSERRSDRELLQAAVTTEPEAFTIFYERHVEVVLAFLRERMSSPEAATDLMAETFAAALLAPHVGAVSKRVARTRHAFRSRADGAR
jgi:hypothetical protein